MTRRHPNYVDARRLKPMHRDVLDALARGGPGRVFDARELGERANLTPAGAAQVAAQLVDRGLARVVALEPTRRSRGPRIGWRLATAGDEAIR